MTQVKRKPIAESVVLEPAVFLPITAVSPAFEAECQELEKSKRTPDEEFNYNLLRARKRWKEQEDRDRAEYRDGYDERLRKRAAIGGETCEWIKPMAEEARVRGFRFFKCEVYRWRLLLQFANGKGAYFQRSVSLGRFADPHGLELSISEELRLNSLVYHYVTELDGMARMGESMRSKRVPSSASSTQPL